MIIGINKDKIYALLMQDFSSDNLTNDIIMDILSQADETTDIIVSEYIRADLIKIRQAIYCITNKNYTLLFSFNYDVYTNAEIYFSFNSTNFTNIKSSKRRFYEKISK